MDKITPETHLEFKAENVIDKSILNKLFFALANGQNQSLLYESDEKITKTHIRTSCSMWEIQYEN